MIRCTSPRAVRSLRAILAGAAVLAMTLSNSAGAQSISIVPDAEFGYFPLSEYGTVPIADVGDNTSHSFDLPAFLWGGQVYTSLSMSSNGYVVVGDGDASSATNQELPNNSAPNNVLAPFWTDLVPGASGQLRIELLGDGVDQFAVMDWAGMEMAGNASLLNSFQIWIGLNGVEDITFLYGDMAGSGGAPYTVGAENFDGSVGAMWSYNGTGEPSPATDFGLRVSSTDGPSVMVPEPSSVALLGLGLTLLTAARVRRHNARRDGVSL